MRGDNSGRGKPRVDPAIRCSLFYGADEAGARALAAELEAAVGRDAERVDLSPSQLKADPSLLADEAAARSLFGTTRYIRVDGVGDESTPAVEALLRSTALGDPVILVGGALRRDSRLVKLLDGDPSAQVRACHPPDNASLVRIAIGHGETLGLRIDPDLAARLVDACGGDRAVLASEVAKIADFADATPGTPRAASEAMLDMIGADSGETDVSVLLDALFLGNGGRLGDALARAANGGMDAVPLVRAVQRRLLAMAAARSDVDRGAAPRAAVERLGRALFWRDKETVLRDLPRWSSARLAAALDRVAALERTLKSSRGPGTIAAGQVYHALARSVRR